jgi:hypothetical protein
MGAFVVARSLSLSLFPGWPWTESSDVTFAPPPLPPCSPPAHSPRTTEHSISFSGSGLIHFSPFPASLGLDRERPGAASRRGELGMWFCTAVTAGTGLGERDVLRWTDAAAGAELPHARGGAAAASWQFASQDVVYMFGGCSEVTCFDDLQRHDQRSGRWAVQAARGKPPTRRKGHSLTLLGPSWAQQLIAFGGWGGDGPVTSSLKAFALATSSWEVLSLAGTPPPSRWAHSATSIDQDRMLVIGGEGVLPGSYFNDVHSFDLSLQQWTRLHPTGDGASGRLLPSPRMGHSACKVGDAVLVFGGYTTETRGSRHHRVASNELWVRLPPAHSVSPPHPPRPPSPHPSLTPLSSSSPCDAERPRPARRPHPSLSDLPL